MRTHIRTVLAATSALALVACGDASVTNFNAEAGAQIDEGGFGNATMNNSLVMMGRADVMSVLNTRFQTEVTPMVNFAFDSAVLDAEAQAILREQANWIQQFPRSGSGSSATPTSWGRTPTTARSVCAGLRRWCASSKARASAAPGSRR
jgi:hypothetical protein